MRDLAEAGAAPGVWRRLPAGGTARQGSDGRREGSQRTRGRRRACAQSRETMNRNGFRAKKDSLRRGAGDRAQGMGLGYTALCPEAGLGGATWDRRERGERGGGMETGQ